MNGTHKGVYAVHAMLMLARYYNKAAITAHVIATQKNISEGFLQSILLELKNADLLTSLRGRKGGYMLRRDPSRIALSEIIPLTGGTISPFRNTEQLHELMTQDRDHNALHEVFRKAQAAATNVLANVTLADLVNANNSLD